ncbi:hypothetical protein, partial [Paraburkholderia tropica]|uniref:hypothetical protein n=1 Tax=Paraburkholderia tropica TaxID=92647 RepID=UPI001E4583CB
MDRRGRHHAGPGCGDGYDELKFGLNGELNGGQIGAFARRALNGARVMSLRETAAEPPSSRDTPHNAC